MSRKPSVLYITPTMPREDGNGLAIRAAMMLDALAQQFEVHLLVIPVCGGPPTPSRFSEARTVRIGSLSLASSLHPYFKLIARVRDVEERHKAALAYPKPFLSRFCTTESVKRVLKWSAPISRLSAVHVMRLYLAPFAEPFLSSGSPRLTHRPYCVLDLDEDDVQVRNRLAWLYAERGHSNGAETERQEAQKFGALAKRYLKLFDHVTVSSDVDRVRIERRYPWVALSVIPNCYPERLKPLKKRTADTTSRLLFVGSLGYYPNEDAALVLGHDVLPQLRRHTRRSLQIDIIGGGGSEAIAAMGDEPEIRLHGFVDDVSPFYAEADVAVVPIRAGGGTRIKLLEAFAHKVPVVSTALGAEGLHVTEGEHLRLADDPEAFARACIAMKEHPQEAAAQADRAAELLASLYRPSRLRTALAAVYQKAMSFEPSMHHVRG